MENIPSKNTGDTYTAAEFNQSNNELKNFVEDSGQTLSGADAFQLSKSAAINASGADYYDDSGIVNAYVLSKPGTVQLRSPVAYFKGMRIRFRPTNNNTGGSTVNVAGVGVVSIIKSDGVTALSAGDLTTAQDAEARYDTGAGAFLLLPVAPEATQSSKGIALLGDQRITLTKNSVDPARDIDFSGGRCTFDDGSGDGLASALTKQLDSAWASGNNQGMLDAGTIAASSTYHTFTIKNPTTGVIDYLASLSATSPTLPPGFTKKRRNGALLTDGSSDILGFAQSGKFFILDNLVSNVDYTGSIPITRSLLPLTTPVGIKARALTRIFWFRGTVAAANQQSIIISDPDQPDQAPTVGASPFFDLFMTTGTNHPFGINAHQLSVCTDLSARIGYRWAGSGVDPTRLVIDTRGWEDYTLE